uniref:Uncharacterized protein n=1 Tax=Tetranychus urticae TaxID=32264 RepID=T1K214_TETUR
MKTRSEDGLGASIGYVMDAEFIKGIGRCRPEFDSTGLCDGG